MRFFFFSLADPETLRSLSVSGLEEGVRVEGGGIWLFPGKRWALVALWLPPVARSWRQARRAALALLIGGPGKPKGVSQK